MGQADASVGGYLLDGTAAGLLAQHGGCRLLWFQPRACRHVHFIHLLQHAGASNCAICPGGLHCWLCPVYDPPSWTSVTETWSIGGRAYNVASVRQAATVVCADMVYRGVWEEILRDVSAGTHVQAPQPCVPNTPGNCARHHPGHLWLCMRW